MSMDGERAPAVGDGQERGADVQAMFAAIAPRYDLLNRLLSFGVDRRWRTLAVRRALEKQPQRILDVATGTGDFALELARQAPDAQVIGSDFVPQMLELAREKARVQQLSLQFEEGDALKLPYPDASFDLVSCAFGFRNFSSYAQGLAELWRVLAPGGRLVLLEFPPPSPGLFGRLYRWYFCTILPKIGGWLSGNAAAYRYLPQSVLAFPTPTRLLDLMTATGFRARYQSLSGGIAGLWVGDKG